MQNQFLVYITTSGQDESKDLAEKAVREKLAACANIYPEIQSVFRWEGKLENSKESVLILKTDESQLENLMEKVKQWHSYDCPCVVALPIAGGNADFLKWIREQVS